MLSVHQTRQHFHRAEMTGNARRNGNTNNRRLKHTTFSPRCIEGSKISNAEHLNITIYKLHVLCTYQNLYLPKERIYLLRHIMKTDHSKAKRNCKASLSGFSGIKDVETLWKLKSTKPVSVPVLSILLSSLQLLFTAGWSFCSLPGYLTHSRRVCKIGEVQI